MSTANTARVTLEFTAAANTKIERMMDRTRKSRVADLLIEALRIYEWALDEREVGNLVGSLDHNRRFTAITE